MRYGTIAVTLLIIPWHMRLWLACMIPRYGNDRPSETLVSSVSRRRIGRYEVIEEIGRGGMARVYRARDTQLQRIVALKVLATQLSLDTEFVKRFEREARTAANLRHPNIVTIYDIGEDQGLHYIAMEYIDGVPLYTILEKHGSLGLGYAIALLEPIAAALDYAHQAGAVHRDIKPHNIMVDRNGRVVLTDFGIVQTLEADDQRLTRTGVFMGTPEYISPEQAEARRVGGHSDLYSLAVVAYEIITGRVPFSGATPQLIVAHAQQPPPPITSIVPDLPAELDIVISRALAKRPERRFQTGAAFIKALRDVAARAGITPASPADLAALVVSPESSTLPGGSGWTNKPVAPPPIPANASITPNRSVPPLAPSRSSPPTALPPESLPAQPSPRRDTPAQPQVLPVDNSQEEKLPFLIIGGLLLIVVIALVVLIAWNFSNPGTPTPLPIVTVPPSPTLAVPVLTATATFTPVPTLPPTATLTPTNTPSPMPPSPTVLPPAPPPAPQPTPTASVTPSPTATETPTASPTTSPTPTETLTPSPTETPTASPTVSPTPTETLTPSPTETPTTLPTPTATPTSSLTETPTETSTPLSTATLTTLPTSTPAYP